MPMNQEIKARWGEWLLAHAGEQGTGWLRAEAVNGTSKFCCLGGLCELAAEAGIVERTKLAKNGVYVYGTPGTPAGQRDARVLPAAVVEWAGVRNPNPAVTYNDDEEGLASLNDREVPFPRIWQLIDAQL